MTKSIYVPGLEHGSAPIPAAAVVNGILMTGAIFGRDRATGKIGDDLDAQCEHMFANARAILDAGGASLRDVVKVTIFLKTGCPRDVLNEYWVREFPQAESRPARHVLVSDSLPAGQLVQCEITAVLAR